MSLEYLPYKVRGEGTKWLVMMAGFPDDEDSFDEMEIEGYRLLCVCMPGYSSKTKIEIPRWGFLFSEIVEALDKTIKKVLGDEKFSLLTHDWGSAIGFMYILKESRVEKFITLDIGLYLPQQLSLKEQLVDLGYKGTLATGFFFRGLGFPTLGTICIALFPWSLIGPCPYETKVPPRVQKWFTRPILAFCYPYFQLFKGLITKTLQLPNPKKIALPPTLFIYGKRKRMMFHSSVFIDSILSANNGSKVIAYDNCGHFIQSQDPKKTSSDVLSFLNS